VINIIIIIIIIITTTITIIITIIIISSFFINGATAHIRLCPLQTVHLQISMFPAILLNPLIFSTNQQSLLLLFSHLSLGFHMSLLPWNFPFSTFFGNLVHPESN